ncbi:hypothetical protein GCM10010470_44960 [Saccharopolyspora taberi]|uniref:Uncharacterized protein n=1 Tax=Saccharopolyspora taberi TaxID=60895 RepID=A0ABN3VH45_9PSEU
MGTEVSHGGGPALPEGVAQRLPVSVHYGRQVTQSLGSAVPRAATECDNRHVGRGLRDADPRFTRKVDGLRWAGRLEYAPGWTGSETVISRSAQSCDPFLEPSSGWRLR